MCAFKKTGKSENYFEENPQRNVDGPNWLGLLQVDRCSEQKYSGWISLNRRCGDVVSFEIAENPESQKWFCQASVSKLLKILKVKSDFVSLPSRTGGGCKQKVCWDGFHSLPSDLILHLGTLVGEKNHLGILAEKKSFISGPWRREKSKQNEPISLPDDPQSKCFRK